MWLALGLPAHVLVKALSPAFFAREDTLTPLCGDAEGIRRRDRAGCRARPYLRRQRYRRQHRARGLEQRAQLDPARRRDIRIFDRRCGAPAAAAHRGGGARHGRSVVADGEHSLPARMTAAAHGARAGCALLGILIAGGMAVTACCSALFGVTGWARGGVRDAAQTKAPPTCATNARVAMDDATRRGNGRREQQRGKLTMAIVERVFSGVQPTGNLHLGNYLGAIVNFVKLQETHNCLYCVVDMHAITQPVEVWGGPAELARNTREVTAAFIASGIDPKKAHRVQPEPGVRTRGTGLDLQLRGAGRLAQPHDPVQGKGRQGSRERVGRSVRLSGADGGRHSAVSRHPCAGRRGPEAAPRTVARHRAEIQQRLWRFDPQPRL